MLDLRSKAIVAELRDFVRDVHEGDANEREMLAPLIVDFMARDASELLAFLNERLGDSIATDDLLEKLNAPVGK